MTLQKQLLECLKDVVLKDFKPYEIDKGAACIENATLMILDQKKKKYIHFIHQSDVCHAQGEKAIIKALQEAEKITNQLFPNLKTLINYGQLD